MPKITIDHKEVEVPDGTNLIDAAEMAGVDIPHYCYHPGLPVAGSCRMCFVEVEGAPKLQIACFTPVKDGMVVLTQTEKVKVTRQAILEFLLVNHPLDCPVCDQAGECYLQIYYMHHGLYQSQVTDNKVKKKKAVPVGEHVMLDSERCVLCSRCVRFSDNVTHTGEFGIINRGNRAEITIFPGREANNRYSGNVVDICPVGALTDRDFRFQCRVWYLKQTPSVCPGCSRGCNIDIHWNGSGRTHPGQGRRVMRLKPRFNAAVNSYWMCDEGRYAYRHIDDERRIRFPRVKHESTQVDTNWATAAQRAAELVSAVPAAEVGVLASPQLTNEDLFAIKAGLIDALGITQYAFALPPAEAGYSDDFLIMADKNPNTRGAEIIGMQSDVSAEQMITDPAAVGIKVLVVFGHDVLHSGVDSEAARGGLGALEALVFVGDIQHDTADLADVVLPAACYAEKDGTFMNFEGRVQRIRRAVLPLGDAEAEWQIVRRLSDALGLDAAVGVTPAEVFAQAAAVLPELHGIDYQTMGDQGVLLSAVEADVANVG